MARPSFFEAEGIAIRRLILAHPKDYARLLEEATAELPMSLARAAGITLEDARRRQNPAP
ncbi:hypothetical protein GCM10010276_89010 [Streptomyces longisporus]|uniref:Uncharacterized protein n=1 Tax=Streptomyces longisporus TaxID=1948 RepID=A0ABN3NJI9_STRLO